MSDAINSAVRRLKETALELERAKRFVDALELFGYEVIFEGRKSDDACEFRLGLSMIRKAIQTKLTSTLADCFLFSAVSEDIHDIALAKLKEEAGLSPAFTLRKKAWSRMGGVGRKAKGGAT